MPIDPANPIEFADAGNGPLFPARDEAVIFTLYQKAVLPLDKFVFWVRADTLSPSALLNSAPFNTWRPGQSPSVATLAPQQVVKGSLHVSAALRQDEDASFALNTVIFTTREKIQDLDTLSDGQMYIACQDGLKFAFSNRTMYSREADLNHYSGDAVYPSMYTQIVDSPAGLDAQLVVSNSLPAWLRIDSITPMLPSYGVPLNLRPPYCTVHIPPERTRVIGGSIPVMTRRSSTYQLCADTVRLTTFGLRNDEFMDLRDAVIASIGSAGDPMGLMSVGAPRDEKATQRELNTLAQKKSIEFEVSYYQHRMRDVARRLIEHVFLDLYYAPDRAPVVVTAP